MYYFRARRDKPEKQVNNVDWGKLLNVTERLLVAVRTITTILPSTWLAICGTYDTARVDTELSRTAGAPMRANSGGCAPWNNDPVKLTALCCRRAMSFVSCICTTEIDASDKSAVPVRSCGIIVHSE